MVERQIKILIVDDNPTNIDLLRRFLQHGPYQISAVTSGIKALQLVQKNRPDIILLDIMMPELDGYQTCERLKADVNTQDIPVIFVTAKVAPEDVRKGFAVGGADYIAKPAHEDEVLARVNNQVQAVEKNILAEKILMKSEKMSALGSLVASIAHEIATPLGSLALSLDVLDDAFVKIRQAFDDKSMTASQFGHFLAETGEAMSIAKQNIENSKQIMESFKLVAVDQCNNRIAKIALKSYIESVLLSLRPLLKKTQHRINLDIDETISIELQAGALSQVLTNLVKNSLMHGFETMSAGQIDIKAGIVDEHLLLSYRDNGCGIPKPQLDRVFDEYFTTKAGKGGSGLGLYIVKHLTQEELGATLTMGSELGQGTWFEFKIPLIPATPH